LQGKHLLLTHKIKLGDEIVEMLEAVIQMLLGTCLLNMIEVLVVDVGVSVQDDK
jgi:hypothetical protein